MRAARGEGWERVDTLAGRKHFTFGKKQRLVLSQAIRFTFCMWVFNSECVVKSNLSFLKQSFSVRWGVYLSHAREPDRHKKCISFVLLWFLSLFCSIDWRVLSSGCLVSFHGHFHLKQHDVQFLGDLTESSTFFSIFSLFFLSLQELRAQGVTAKQVFKKAEWGIALWRKRAFELSVSIELSAQKKAMLPQRSAPPPFVLKQRPPMTGLSKINKNSLQWVELQPCCP